MRTWFYDSNLQVQTFEDSLKQKRQSQIKISVGIITYKRPSLLRESLNAIVPQLNQFTEILILIDGDDPETERLLLNYIDPLIRVIRNENNMGRPISRNRVIAEACGEYILWVDDDDLAKPDIISTYLDLVRADPDIDVAYCDLEVVDMPSNKYLRTLSADNVGGCGAKFLQSLISGTGITSGGSIIRRLLYLRARGFDERFHKAQDNEFWYRAALFAKFQKVERVLYTYRLHAESGSVHWNRDCSYSSFALRNALKRIPLQIIYPNLNWNDPNSTIVKILSYIGFGLYKLGDAYHASRYLEMIPREQIRVEVLEILVRCYIEIGNFRAAYSICQSLVDPSGGIGEVVHMFLAFIRQADQLEIEIEQAWETKDRKILRDKLKEYKDLVGQTYFSCQFNAKRFLSIGDNRRAHRAMYAAFRYQPFNRQLYQSLLDSSPNDELKENVKDLADRMVDLGSILYSIDRNIGSDSVNLLMAEVSSL